MCLTKELEAFPQETPGERTKEKAPASSWGGAVGAKLVRRETADGAHEPIPTLLLGGTAQIHNADRRASAQVGPGLNKKAQIL